MQMQRAMRHDEWDYVRYLFFPRQTRETPETAQKGHSECNNNAPASAAAGSASRINANSTVASHKRSIFIFLAIARRSKGINKTNEAPAAAPPAYYQVNKVHKYCPSVHRVVLITTRRR